VGLDLSVRDYLAARRTEPLVKYQKVKKPVWVHVAILEA